jgi:hypothetical protein
LEDACPALKGPAPSRFHDAIREKVDAAVKEIGHPDCRKVFEKVFGTPKASIDTR